MFISLKRLSRESTVAGELASFLLGKTSEIKNEKVKQIADTLTKSCDEFCIDKGVKKSMSVAEELRMEGRLEGIEEGIQQGIQQGVQQGVTMLAELIKAGLSLEEALEKVNGNTEQ